MTVAAREPVVAARELVENSDERVRRSTVFQQTVIPAWTLLQDAACRRATPVAIIELMATVRITEAELARDLHTVLEKVRQGVEVVIEQDSRPVAVIKAPMVHGRKISEVIAALEASGANAVIDEDFARDVEQGIKAHREPWNPPSWD